MDNISHTTVVFIDLFMESELVATSGCSPCISPTPKEICDTIEELGEHVVKFHWPNLNELDFLVEVHRISNPKVQI
jgi:hypothetical protein